VRLDTEADEAAGAWRADPAPEGTQALADVLGQLIHALREHMRLEEQGIFPLVKDRAQPDGIPFPSGPLTGAERRILRYLPTHLSAREIAAQLFCSVNTVKTHQRHVYAKLGANSRTEAVTRARALGILGPARASLNGHVTSAPADNVRPANTPLAPPANRPNAPSDRS
jgi:DNA-binding CsgD family transcriptional regulator